MYYKVMIKISYFQYFTEKNITTLLLLLQIEKSNTINCYRKKNICNDNNIIYIHTYIASAKLEIDVYRWNFLNCLENRFSSIGPIYYEYGSMVIIYEDSNKAVRALYTLRESKYEDKHLLGIYNYIFQSIFYN